MICYEILGSNNSSEAHRATFIIYCRVKHKSRQKTGHIEPYKSTTVSVKKGELFCCLNWNVVIFIIKYLYQGHKLCLVSYTKKHNLVAQSYQSLCNSKDCSPPGSSVHGILQARILEWVAISFSRGSSWPRDWTHVSCVSCANRWVPYHYRALGSPYTKT